jgi:recombination protein RecA
MDMKLDPKFDSFLSALDKEFGANDVNQAVTQWIDTGNPEMNRIISGSYDGGLPFGRLVEMFGESSTGKTAIATQCMVQAQKMGGIAVFIDWERSFDVFLAEGFGLNTERPYWFYYKPKTWEEGNTIGKKLAYRLREMKIVPPDAPILFVYDSIASAVPKSVFEKELDEHGMNDTTALARVSSTTLKNMAQFAEDTNSTHLYLNQVREKPGVVYGSNITTPGGKAPEFYASARLCLKRQKIMDKGDSGEKEFLGQNIVVQAVKSKFTRPFQECNLRLMYEGEVAVFDHIAALLELLVKKGWVSYSKPYVTWTDGKKYYVKSLVKHLKEQEDGLEQLKAFLPKSEEDSDVA